MHDVILKRSTRDRDYLAVGIAAIFFGWLLWLFASKAFGLTTATFGALVLYSYSKKKEGYIVFGSKEIEWDWNEFGCGVRNDPKGTINVSMVTELAFHQDLAVLKVTMRDASIVKIPLLVAARDAYNAAGRLYPTLRCTYDDGIQKTGT